MDYLYGEERWRTSTLPTDYRFTGQRLSAELGLYHMGARWYDPYLNRWLSPDSIVPNAANPQGFNHYSYVYNQPLRWIDPNGHIPILLVPIVVAAIVWLASPVYPPGYVFQANSDVYSPASMSEGFIRSYRAIGTEQAKETTTALATGVMGTAAFASTGGIGGALGSVALSTALSGLAGTGIHEKTYGAMSLLLTNAHYMAENLKATSVSFHLLQTPTGGYQAEAKRGYFGITLYDARGNQILVNQLAWESQEFLPSLEMSYEEFQAFLNWLEGFEEISFSDIGWYLEEYKTQGEN